ncbi:MAG: hypothetical protein ACI9S8_002728 [Chlamydiales bacterium]|jgi:hypothetical protein
MKIHLVKEIIEDLYEDCKGSVISSKQRTRENIENDKNLVYGEISIESIAGLLEYVKPKENEIFYDLGSGIGKMLLTVALLSELKEVKGIEVLGDMHACAEDKIKIFQEEIRPQYDEQWTFPRIENFNDNIENFDFSEADIVYACATCFEPELMDVISRKMLSLRKGSRVVTVTRELTCEGFKTICDLKFAMSWGTSRTLVYEKIV